MCSRMKAAICDIDPFGAEGSQAVSAEEVPCSFTFIKAVPQHPHLQHEAFSEYFTWNALAPLHEGH